MSDQLLATAARIAQRVAQLGQGVGCSIGIRYPANGLLDADTLLAEADAAMYGAKRQGKNRVQFASAGQPLPNTLPPNSSLLDSYKLDSLTTKLH